MADSFDITWQVEDGYSGRARPQGAYVNLDDVIDCADEAEIREVILDIVKDEFDATISYFVQNIDEAVSWAKNRIDGASK